MGVFMSVHDATWLMFIFISVLAIRDMFNG
nr:MAG TPA: hypothetical protein [Inoviridae sp.]